MADIHLAIRLLQLGLKTIVDLDGLLKLFDELLKLGLQSLMLDPQLLMVMLEVVKLAQEGINVTALGRWWLSHFFVQHLGARLHEERGGNDDNSLGRNQIRKRRGVQRKPKRHRLNNT